MKLKVHRFNLYIQVNGNYPLTDYSLRDEIRRLVKENPKQADVIKNELLLLSEDISEMARVKS